MKTDKLTELLYYDDFIELAQETLKKIDKPCILISLNVSNFKYINNVYGYEKGDKLLLRLADYFFHNNEYCVLASRIHSDRFVGLVHIGGDMSEEHMVEHFNSFCKEFVRQIENDYPMAVLRINSGAYIVRDNCENISEMLDKAEVARRSIENDYSRLVSFFTEALETREKMERRIIPLFEKALKDDSILVYLQPKIDIDSQTIVGAEALARLVDEDGKIVPPALFIPVLEKYGLVKELDMYVVRKVFRLLNTWYENGQTIIPISLNLSRIDFKQADEWIEMMEQMEPLKVPKEYVEFEVTETVFFEDLSMITGRVQQLRKKGFRISMDDFGTGFSSLNTLGMLPIDCIKFDRGFVQNSINSRKGLEIMAGLVDIFDKIDLDVICEGVETSSEEQIIRACGCKQVQGYLHDKPMPIRDFEAKYIANA